MALTKFVAMAVTSNQFKAFAFLRIQNDSNDTKLYNKEHLMASRTKMKLIRIRRY